VDGISDGIGHCNGRGASSAVFGLSGSSNKHHGSSSISSSSNSNSNIEKLDAAAALMRTRVAQLQTRATAHREEAVQLAKAGQKQCAMRALKKAHGLEKQVQANQSNVDAVEQQIDVLSQAQVQKTLAQALASTSKTMKRDAKALGKAEAAIDAAQEARDVASDLSDVMAEFASTGNGVMDDEELASELEKMITMTKDDRDATAQLTEHHSDGDARIEAAASASASAAATASAADATHPSKEFAKAFPKTPSDFRCETSETQRVGLVAASET
jgi:hypothetical protein